MQFATNHLGHVALATGLHSALAADGAARIVVVSSNGRLFSSVVFDDIHEKSYLMKLSGSLDRYRAKLTGQ